VCALRIDKLCEHPAEILLLGCHAEEDTLRAHLLVESFDIGDSETQFDLSRWVLVGSGMQREADLTSLADSYSACG